nr:putative reverse transcriptase domain-containing protein [Tanacetum cinerariifolium]
VKSSTVATQQLSSRNSFALAVANDAKDVLDWIYVRGVSLLLAFACSRFGVLVMSVIEMWGTGVRVGRGGRGGRPREGNDERVDDLNGQGNDQGMGANRGIEGVNENLEGANRGASDFSTIIAQQLQDLLPVMLAQVGNQRNVGNQNEVKKRGNVGEPNKDKNGRDDSKRTKTENAFATTVNPARRENTCTWPKCTTCNSYHAPRRPCRTCFNCTRPGHLAKDCRGVSRNVNLVNARNPSVRACYECGSSDHVRSSCPRLNREQGPKENRPNQVAANNGGQGHGNQRNQARVIEMCELNIKYEWEIRYSIYVSLPTYLMLPIFSLVLIMPLRMWSRSADRPAVESLGGGTSVRVGRGGRIRRLREGNDERVDDLNGQGNDQGMGANEGVEGVNGNVEGANGGAPDFLTIIAQQLQNLLPTMLDQIEKMKSMHDMSGCSIDQKVKYIAGLFVEYFPSHEMQNMESELWNHAMVGAGHAAYTDRFHELARLVPHLVTLESGMIERYVYGLALQICRIVAATEPKTIQKVVQISSALTDEAEERIWVLGPSVPPATPTMHSKGLVAHALTAIARNQARVRAFMLGAEEARQDSNTVTGMDWLSNHKAEIICHEKVVRIPLLYGKVLRVLGEQLDEKIRHVKSAKAKDKKQRELIPRVVPIAKPPYRLAPSELKELSGQLKELQDKDPSKIEAVKNWKALRTPTKVRSFLALGKEQELEFQTLKGKLCNAPVLALLEGPKEFVVYYDAFGIGLGCVLMQREFQTLKGKLCNAPVLALLEGPEEFVVYYDVFGIGLGCVLMQRELFSDYDCEIRYHPGEANAVADALSRKERVKPKRVRAMNMILQSSIKDRIPVSQKEAMDEFARLTSSGHDTIWVIMDRLTKSAHFLHMREDYKMDRLDRLYLDEIVARHGDTLKAARDQKKSYADKWRKPLEFSVGDDVLLKVSPWKGVVRFRKKGKLAPRFVGPFEIIEKVGLVAYWLDLPKELNGVHDTFHVSNLKKCLADPTLHVPLDELRVDAKLNFVEEPVEILKREFKKLKHSRISIVKVR